MEKILIFGRGDYFKNKAQTFLDRFQIVGFLDNAVGDEIIDGQYGVPVYHPSKAKELEDYAIYCVATDFFGMWQQLKELQIEDDRIKFGAEIAPQQPGIEKTAFSNGEVLRSKGSVLIYVSHGKEHQIASLDDLKEVLRYYAKMDIPDISLISKLNNSPVSRTFGSERGKAVDRYYIELFLNTYANDIKGTVMEVANNNYTLMFGGQRVEKSIISHVMGWGKDAIKVNFETGEGIVENSIDCLICTQTLQYIFDLPQAMKNIYKALKPNGVALITVPGIKPLCEYDSNLWGEYWSFTVKSMDRLCNSIIDKSNYLVKQYGNSKAAVAYLYGVCLEELDIKDLEYYDDQYPFIIAARIKK